MLKVIIGTLLWGIVLLIVFGWVNGTVSGLVPYHGSNYLFLVDLLLLPLADAAAITIWALLILRIHGRPGRSMSAIGAACVLVLCAFFLFQTPWAYSAGVADNLINQFLPRIKYAAAALSLWVFLDWASKAGR